MPHMWALTQNQQLQSTISILEKIDNLVWSPTDCFLSSSTTFWWVVRWFWGGSDACRALMKRGENGSFWKRVKHLGSWISRWSPRSSWYDIVSMKKKMEMMMISGSTDVHSKGSCSITVEDTWKYTFRMKMIFITIIILNCCKAILVILISYWTTVYRNQWFFFLSTSIVQSKWWSSLERFGITLGPAAGLIHMERIVPLILA